MLARRFDHVVWDWNGTLLDDVELAVSVMNTILDDFELPSLDVPRYRALFEFPVRSYYGNLGIREDDDFEVAARRFVDGYADRATECGLRAGARRVIEELVAGGVGCSVLSASEQAPLDWLVGHHRLSPLLSHVQGLDDHYAHGKVDAGRAWASRAGINPERTLMVGDTVHDHEVAEELGLDCVLVADGHQSADKLRATGRRVIDSIDGVFATLR